MNIPIIYGGRLCSDFKKTVEPKCNDQTGCRWIKRPGKRGSCESIDMIQERARPVGKS